jgi:glycolate oxidase FAD binding subunit
VQISETYYPRSEDELARLVSDAVVKTVPLEICANRTKSALGRPLQVGARISLREMRGVTLYEPNELVLSAKAGTPLAEIEKLLAQSGQELAFEPCALERALAPDIGPSGEPTFGGAIAVNASGPRRILRGAARDHLIGVRAVNGRGEVIKSGGRVMKNVTGYDVARAMAGSFGTLAVMSEITVKVLPKAEETRTLICLNLSDESAVSAICRALGSAFEVSGAVHLQKPFAERMSMPDVASLGQSVTALRLENFSSSVEYRLARLHQELKPFGTIYEMDDSRSRAFWGDIKRLQFLTGTDWPLWRITTAPHQGARLVSALAAQMTCRASYDWSGGLIWLEVPPSTDASATVLRRVIAEFQADALLVRASPAARASVSVFQPLPEVNMNLIRRLKEAFDPHRILNPGRMYPGI